MSPDVIGELLNKKNSFAVGGRMETPKNMLIESIRK